MAVAAEQLTRQTVEQQKPERFEFFDINASIDLMRYDIQMHGQVLPETRQRVCDEELTYVAEGIDRPLHTSFEYREQNGELQYFSEGSWKPYMQLLYNGLRSTDELAQADPRKQFLHDMAVTDLANGYAMHKLKPGEAMSWYSPYRDDIEFRYGADFVESCGFQPQRRMGFLYRATKRNDGTVVLESHSVDNSSEQAFSVAMQVSANTEAGIDTMVRAYDATLHKETGIVHSAGRQNTSGQKEQNAWYAIRQHGDLMGMYFSDLEALAHTVLSREQTEQQKKRLTIGFWAALKERINKPITREYTPLQNIEYNNVEIAQQQAQLRAEMSIAYQRAASKGEGPVGCGGSMKALVDPFNKMSLEDSHDSIFGNDEASDDIEEDAGDGLGPLTFKCTEGHDNTRDFGELLTVCKIKPCKPGSVGC